MFQTHLYRLLHLVVLWLSYFKHLYQWLHTRWQNVSKNSRFQAYINYQTSTCLSFIHTSVLVVDGSIEVLFLTCEILKENTNFVFLFKILFIFFLASDQRKVCCGARVVRTTPLYSEQRWRSALLTWPHWDMGARQRTEKKHVFRNFEGDADLEQWKKKVAVAECILKGGKINPSVFRKTMS